MKSHIISNIRYIFSFSATVESFGSLLQVALQKKLHQCEVTTLMISQDLLLHVGDDPTRTKLTARRLSASTVPGYYNFRIFF